MGGFASSTIYLPLASYLLDFKTALVLVAIFHFFGNISIPAGHFSVKYIFPDDGTHQVPLTLDKGNDFKIPASFDVFVPHQSPPSILDPFPSSPGTTNGDLGIWISKILAISVPVTAITAIIIILKKKPKKHS
jgi:hypothetical protein